MSDKNDKTITCALCGKVMDHETIYPIGKTPSACCGTCFHHLPDCVRSHPCDITEVAARALLRKQKETKRRINPRYPYVRYKNMDYFQHNDILRFSGYVMEMDNISGFTFYSTFKEELPDKSGAILHIWCKVFLREPAVYLLDYVGESPLFYRNGPLSKQKPWDTFYRLTGLDKERKEKNAHKGGTNDQKRNDPDPIHDAKILFMINGDYTLDELKSRYHKLQKAFHPDNGEGDSEASQKINDAYAVLKRAYQVSH